MRNPFDKLPNEIVVQICGLVSSPVELRALSQVNLYFNQLLKRNQEPCRQLCLNWWRKQELQKEFDLEKDNMKECTDLDQTKNWKWLSTCISHQNARDGLSWIRFTDSRGNLTEIVVGNMRDGLLNGFGFTLFYDMKCIGRFKDGKQLDGVSIFPGVERYIGEYSMETGHFDGLGVYTSLDKGWTYAGELKKSEFHGKGVMTWPNGFRYDGMWESGEPQDLGKCLAPDLKKCIEVGVCTGTVTQAGNSGQFMVAVTDREELYCAICVKRCCLRDVPLSKPLWFPAGHCICTKKRNCKAHVELFKGRMTNLKDGILHPLL